MDLMASMLAVSRELCQDRETQASLITRLGWKGMEGPHSPSLVLHIAFTP